ncbi:MAG: polysaccharide biosynthesis protein, partial [Candidatus Latescibacterota bacterium]
MEDHPEESVRNNAFGTRTVAQAALRPCTERFVLTSADKGNEEQFRPPEARCMVRLHHILRRPPTPRPGRAWPPWPWGDPSHALGAGCQKRARPFLPASRPCRDCLEYLPAAGWRHAGQRAVAGRWHGPGGGTGGPPSPAVGRGPWAAAGPQRSCRVALPPSVVWSVPPAGTGHASTGELCRRIAVLGRRPAAAGPGGP